MTKVNVTIEGPTELEDMAQYQDYFKDLDNYTFGNDEDGFPQITFLAEEELALERFGKFCSENPDEIFYNMLFRDEDGELIKKFTNSNGEVGEQYAAKKAATPSSMANENYDDILNYLDNLDEDDEDDEDE